MPFLPPPWRPIPLPEAVKQFAGVDFAANVTLAEARKAAEAALTNDSNLQTPQNHILAEQLHRFFNKKVDWSKIS